MIIGDCLQASRVIINLRLTDPDDIIRRLLAFGAWFRTPASLFLKKSTLLGVFMPIATLGSFLIPKVGNCCI